MPTCRIAEIPTFPPQNLEEWATASEEKYRIKCRRLGVKLHVVHNVRNAQSNLITVRCGEVVVAY